MVLSVTQGRHLYRITRTGKRLGMFLGPAARMTIRLVTSVHSGSDDSVWQVLRIPLAVGRIAWLAAYAVNLSITFPSNISPFFHNTRTSAAILRATVRRTISGAIFFSIRIR